MAYRLAKLSGRTAAVCWLCGQGKGKGTLSGTNELEIVVIVRHMSSTEHTKNMYPI